MVASFNLIPDFCDFDFCRCLANAASAISDAARAAWDALGSMISRIREICCCCFSDSAVQDDHVPHSLEKRVEQLPAPQVKRPASRSPVESSQEQLDDPVAVLPPPRTWRDTAADVGYYVGKTGEYVAPVAAVAASAHPLTIAAASAPLVWDTAKNVYQWM